MATSKIEWTDATWNPVTGCTPVSPGCAHCYAARMAKRLAGRFGYQAAPHEFDVALHPERLEKPLHWKKPRRVFVVSMGDLFHEDVPDEYIDAVFAVMAAAERHTFQVLTKRADRMAQYFEELSARAQMYFALGRRSVPYETSRILEMWRNHSPDFTQCSGRHLPLSNVWLGVSAENQAMFYERYSHLAQINAAVRYVSFEPLLSAIDMEGATPDWVICGGESGPGARAMHPDWARGLRDQCVAAGVPFFFKQWGAWLPYGQDMAEAEWETETFERFRALIAGGAPFARFGDGETVHRVGKKRAGRRLDGREWNEYPEGGL